MGWVNAIASLTLNKLYVDYRV